MMQMNCRKVLYNNSIWDQLPAQRLVDVASGAQPRVWTTVQVCRDSGALYVRFVCEEDHTVSDYTKRDEPLYEQDVVEIFLDEEGTGRRYVELEVSPHNVIFDAVIKNDGRTVEALTEWDAAGLETRVDTQKNKRIYTIKLPLVHFAKMPEAGTSWRVNFYRIDESPEGKREFQAWSPTGSINYHVPSRFGTLAFV